MSENDGLTAEEREAAAENEAERFGESLEYPRTLVPTYDEDGNLAPALEAVDNYDQPSDPSQVEEEPAAPEVLGEDGEIDFEALDGRLDVLEGAHGPMAQKAAQDAFQAELRALEAEYPELEPVEQKVELAEAMRLLAADVEHETGEPGVALALVNDPGFMRWCWQAVLDGRGEAAADAESRPEDLDRALQPGEEMFLDMWADRHANKLPWD
jgi:hypothetical protein